VLTEIYVIK